MTPAMKAALEKCKQNTDAPTLEEDKAAYEKSINQTKTNWGTRKGN